MKSAILRDYGGPEVLIYGELPTPTPGPGEALVRILAAGLNRLDHYLREGSVTRDLALPHILGSDAAGLVVAVGRGVTRVKEGDRVIPMPGYPLNAAEAGHHPLSAAPSYAIRGIVEWGTYAEFMVVPEIWLLRDDTGLPPEQVATLPMPLITAARAVRSVGEVKAGDRVLVHAGASGTGAAAIQVAKALGAQVATTLRSPEKEAFVRGLGVDLVLDLATEDLATATRDWTQGRGLDVVIDNLGGPIFARSVEALRPLGVMVSMGMVLGLEATLALRPFFFTQKQIRGTLMGGMEDLQWGLEQVKAGHIRPMLDQIYSLQDAAAAHRRLADGRATGSIVLVPA